MSDNPPVIPNLPIPVPPPLPTPVSAESSRGEVQGFAERVREEMHKVIVGQENLIDMLLVAVLTKGHVLLEGVPGTAKTLSIRTLALLFQTSFSRIQFTPDLMPSDILGTNVFDPRNQEFQMRRGPIFAGLVLADEINRTPPKTQSALLEAMEERKVTIDGVPYSLPEPFMVCATQNPIDYEGTYPLPEAQLDRFMLKVAVPYPDLEAERSLLERTQQGFRAQHLQEVALQPVLDTEELVRYQEEVERVRAESVLQDYILQIVRATRSHRYLAMGASPRATITLLLTSKALAAMQGRNFITPDDVQALTYPVLCHRLILRPDAEHQGQTSERILESILQSIPVPR